MHLGLPSTYDDVQCVYVEGFKRHPRCEGATVHDLICFWSLNLIEIPPTPRLTSKVGSMPISL